MLLPRFARLNQRNRRSSPDPKQRCPDIGAAKQHLAWAPRVELREGLAKTVAYFELLLRQKAPQALSAQAGQ